MEGGAAAALSASGAQVLPDGPVEAHMAWICAGYRKQNWHLLWKPTGDAMGPILGEPDLANVFNPNDDRIVYLGLHLLDDGRAGHEIDVALWWRSAPAVERPRPMRRPGGWEG